MLYGQGYATILDNMLDDDLPDNSQPIAARSRAQGHENNNS